MSIPNLNLSDLLNAPFPYSAYRANYEGQAYVGVQWMVDRLNEVLGPLNWRHEFFDVKEDMEDFSVELIGRLLVFDDEKKTWMERVNFGNATMTILRERNLPTAQDRMACKKSAVSDSLKKCAAWFGVASDVFKGLIDVIKPLKSNGEDNPIYYMLVATRGFLHPYGAHKNGIPVLPDSYQHYYKDKEWEGIFQSDLRNLYSKPGIQGDAKPSGQNASQSPETGPSSIRPDDNTAGASGDSRSNPGSRISNSRGAGSCAVGSNSRGHASSNSGSSTKPSPIRMKVLDAPKFNSDGSATFKAMLENSMEVSVFANKELAEEVRKIRPNVVIRTTGWFREDLQKVTLATRGGRIDVETAA